MWGCMCWTGQFKCRWSRGYIYNSSYYHHQIGSINLSHCCHIFLCLGVWGDCAFICCRFYTYTHKHTGIYMRLQLLCSRRMCANNRVDYGLMVVYGYLHITLSYYHQWGDLSAYWTANIYIYIYWLECVTKIRTVLSIIFHAIYGVVCIQLTHFLLMIVRIPPLDLIIIIKSEVWPISPAIVWG